MLVVQNTVENKTPRFQMKKRSERLGCNFVEICLSSRNKADAFLLFKRRFSAVQSTFLARDFRQDVGIFVVTKEKQK